MNTTFKKYLISICILFLGGYSFLYAHEDLNDRDQSAIQGLAFSKILNCSRANQQSGAAFNESRRKETRKELVAEEIDTAEEEEENEKVLPSNTREQVYGGFTTAFFYTLLFGHFLVEFKKAFPHFSPHVFAVSYKRHIRFQVFRI